MNGRFNGICAAGGRDSISPEMLIQAWASQKGFRPDDGPDDRHPGGSGRNAHADGKGKPRSNDTRASTTGPDARVYRKSHNTAAIFCCQGHADGEPKRSCRRRRGHRCRRLR